MPHALFIALFGLLSILSLGTIIWLLSLALRDVSIIDIAWGLGFIVLASIYALGLGAQTPRQLVLLIMVTAWGLRLSLYLLHRKWGTPEDHRYQAMRASHGQRFAWVSLVTVFWLQAVILWIVALPLFEVFRQPGPEHLTAPLDIAAILAFAIGLFFETVGDWQLSRFKADPANRGTILDRGLWRYTRHPNYFGDALVWWGFFLMAAVNPGSWWTIVSPILMTILLLKISGVALLEKTLTETKPGYRDYLQATSAFIPWPPRRRRG